MVALRWGALTDVGRARNLNEDAIVAEFPVFAVADGMGGHAAGEVASGLTADHLADLAAQGDPTGERLRNAIRTANTAIFRKSLADPTLRGMGTTVCALSLMGDHISIANVGDSRVYMVSAGHFEQVSKDHSYVGELVDAGEITWAQARSHPHRNIVTRALGIEPEVLVDLWEMPANVGDRFLLCSDGLVDEVIDTDIADLLNQFADPQDAADELVRLANHNGGHDNISVVVVDVIAGDKNDPPTTMYRANDLTSGPPTGPVAIVAPAPMVIEPYAAEEEVVAPAPKALVRRRTANRVRGVVFAAVILGIIGTIIGGVRFYGNAGAFVGLKGDNVTVFKGRNGGVLWVSPKVVHTTKLTTAQLSQAARDQVTKTVSFTDAAAADAWIDALGKNPTLAPGNMPATTTTAATTTTTTTTVEPTTTTSTTLPGP